MASFAVLGFTTFLLLNNSSEIPQHKKIAAEALDYIFSIANWTKTVDGSYNVYTEVS